MESLNTLNGVQSGAVDPSTQNPVNAGASEVVTPKAGAGVASETKTAETAKPTEPATAAKQGAKEADKPKQTKEENAAIAEMRRKYQEAQRQLDEARREREKVDGTLAKYYGATGATLSDKADEITARSLGISVEELRAREAVEARKLDALVEKHPKFQELAAKLTDAEQREQERVAKEAKEIRAKDLAAIKAAFPDETAEAVDELGEQFRAMRYLGVDALTAYNAIRATRKLAEPEPKPEPPAMGAVGEQSAPEPEFYSSEELAKLDKNPKLLDDPKTLAKAIKSLTRLKQK